jgi:hypothetical protein
MCARRVGRGFRRQSRIPEQKDNKEKACQENKLLQVCNTDPVYVGLAVCAHDNKVIEEAEFAEVRLTPVTPAAGKPRLNSTLEIVPVGSKDRQAIYHSTCRQEGVSSPSLYLWRKPKLCRFHFEIAAKAEGGVKACHTPMDEVAGCRKGLV